MASGLDYLHNCHYMRGGSQKGKHLQFHYLMSFDQNNILIKDNGKACLSDFGCTLLLDEELLGSSTLTIISVRWSALVLSEEVFKPRPSDIRFWRLVLRYGNLGSRSCSLYQFACTLKLLLCGSLPDSYHAGMPDRQVTLALQRGRKPLGPAYHQVSELVWESLQCCWEYKSGQRPSVSGFK